MYTLSALLDSHSLPTRRSSDLKLISGWQVQGIYTAQSGAPLGFGNAIFVGDLKDIPLPKNQRTPDRWFNVDAGFERNRSEEHTSELQSLRLVVCSFLLENKSNV